MTSGKIEEIPHPPMMFWEKGLEEELSTDVVGEGST